MTIVFNDRCLESNNCSRFPTELKNQMLHQVWPNETNDIMLNVCKLQHNATLNKIAGGTNRPTAISHQHPLKPIKYVVHTNWLMAHQSLNPI